MLPSTSMRGSSESLATMLVESLLKLHRQDRFTGLVEAATAATAQAGTPCTVASLLRDQATGGWYVTALVDPGGHPLPMGQYGLPSDHFAFTPPTGSGPHPLATVLEPSWGAAACQAIARDRGVTHALCAPIHGAGGPRGALIGLLASDGAPNLAAGILAHAARAAEWRLDNERQALTDGVLDAASLDARVSEELARASRYHREVAVVVLEAETPGELARLGPALVRSVRRWDVVGRPNTAWPSLVAALPETGRGGARGLLRRLGPAVSDLRAGVACFPDDGGSLVRLTEVARGRMGRGAFSETRARRDPAGSIWTRRGLPGPDADTIHCPRCLISYTGMRPAGAPDAVLDRARTAAREHLQRNCPQHPEKVVVST